MWRIVWRGQRGIMRTNESERKRQYYDHKRTTMFYKTLKTEKINMEQHEHHKYWGWTHVSYSISLY